VEQLEKNVAALELHLAIDELELLEQMYRPRDVINDYVPNPVPRYLQGVNDGPRKR
jgi:hypothetical protein